MEPFLLSPILWACLQPILIGPRYSHFGLSPHAYVKPDMRVWLFQESSKATSGSHLTQFHCGSHFPFLALTWKDFGMNEETTKRLENSRIFAFPPSLNHSLLSVAPRAFFRSFCCELLSALNLRVHHSPHKRMKHEQWPSTHDYLNLELQTKVAHFFGIFSWVVWCVKIQTCISRKPLKTSSESFPRLPAINSDLSL